jgi:hypothetical protein
MKARERGAPAQGIDSELRSIFQQLDSGGREAMKTFLLSEDSIKYQWLKGGRKSKGAEWLMTVSLGKQLPDRAC